MNRNRAALWMSAFVAVVSSLAVGGCDKNIEAIGSGTLDFSTAAFSAGEASGSATVTVRRVGGVLGAVSVNYFTSDGSAQAGSDYTPAAGVLSWAAGDASPRTFTVPITSDAFVEGDETLTLALSGPTGGAVLGLSSAVLTILDDDAVSGVYQFSAAAYSAGEGAGTATITVTRTGVTTGAGTVDYATSNGTATALDYTVGGRGLGDGHGAAA